MAHFIFKAKRPTGEIYKGEKDLEDRFALYKIIRESGDEILTYEERKVFLGFHMPKNIDISFTGVKTVEKINIARNLGGMLEAGLTLSRALQVLEHQAKKKSLKNVLSNLMAEIDKGSTFADSLAKHPKVFPMIFIAMVHAGEQSGTLAESLKNVASQMENSYTLTKKVKGALIYPGVIVTVMILIATLMLIFVVPTLMKTFTELKVDLPTSTKIVLGISDALQKHGILVLIGLGLVIAFVLWLKRQPFGRRLFHRSYLHIPLIGNLVQEVNTARTARTLSSLLASGVDVVEAVNITATVVQNVHYQNLLEDAKNSIKKGEPLSKVFNENGKLYPLFFSEMINVGEETGRLGEMLQNVAKYYEEDVSQRTKDMSTVIEPILMVFVGAAVGFFAISMITPMYSLVNAI